jgi:tetratricopeptide (TPR) repeat protein
MVGGTTTPGWLHVRCISQLTGKALSVSLVMLVMMIGFLEGSGISGEIDKKVSVSDLLHEAGIRATALRKGFQLKVLPLIAVAQAKARASSAARANFQLSRDLLLASADDTGGFPNRELLVVEGLAQLGIAQATAGMSDDATDTFHDAVTRASKIADYGTRLLAYSSIAAGQILAGQNLAAESTLDSLDLKMKEGKEDRSSLVRVTRTIGDAYLTKGNTKQAKWYWTKTVRLARNSLNVSPDGPSRSQMLLDLVTVQAKMADFTGVKETFQKIRNGPNPIDPIHAAVEIAATFRDSRQFQLAHEWIERARTLAMRQQLKVQNGKTLEGPTIWKRIALTYAELGYVDQAVAANRMIAFAPFRMSTPGYQAIADLNAGNLRSALEHLRVAGSEHIDLMADLTQKLAKTGDLETANISFNLLNDAMQASSLTNVEEKPGTREDPSAFLQTIRALATAKASHEGIAAAEKWVRAFSAMEAQVYGLLGAVEGTLS